MTMLRAEATALAEVWPSEPWTVEPATPAPNHLARAADGSITLTSFVPVALQRAVACVNACAGLPTAALVQREIHEAIVAATWLTIAMSGDKEEVITEAYHRLCQNLTRLKGGSS